jgi:uncharacterized membrane protein
MSTSERVLREFFAHHRGKFWGSVLGFVVSVMVMKLGLMWTLFICLAVVVGYVVGKHVDDEQEHLTEALERLFPTERP